MPRIGWEKTVQKSTAFALDYPVIGSQQIKKYSVESHSGAFWNAPPYESPPE